MSLLAFRPSAPAVAVADVNLFIIIPLCFAAVSRRGGLSILCFYVFQL